MGRPFSQHSFREPLFLIQFSTSMGGSLQLLHDLPEKESCKWKYSTLPTPHHFPEILYFPSRFVIPIRQRLLNSLPGTHLGMRNVTCVCFYFLIFLNSYCLTSSKTLVYSWQKKSQHILPYQRNSDSPYHFYCIQYAFTQCNAHYLTAYSSQVHILYTCTAMLQACVFVQENILSLCETTGFIIRDYTCYQLQLQVLSGQICRVCLLFSIVVQYCLAFFRTSTVVCVPCKHLTVSAVIVLYISDILCSKQDLYSSQDFHFA